MWLTLGLIVGGLFVGLIFWTRSRDINVSWYEWIISIVGVLLLMFAVRAFIDARAESQINAANTSIWFFGLPGIILIGIAIALVLRRRRLAT